MTEIIKRRERLRTDKTPSPNDLPPMIRPVKKLREPDGLREYLFLCPMESCRRAVRMAYRQYEPLYCCMGGPKPHVRTMLVCENYDIYCEMYYRWMGKGEDLGKPIIYPRNYRKFPVLASGELMRDVGNVGARDRA